MSIGGLIDTLVEGLTPPNQPSGRRRPVTDDQITAVLEAARIAPSARNMQTPGVRWDERCKAPIPHSLQRDLVKKFGEQQNGLG